jgi:transcription elongation factor Elf1
MLGGVEYFFACPYCSERTSMVLDTSVKRQTYIEDCEVCCQPIEVSYAVKQDEVRVVVGDWWARLNMLIGRITR